MGQIAAAIATLLAVTGVTLAQDAPPDPVATSPPTTYIARVNMGPHTVCTAFYVGTDMLVTAGHCVRKDPNAAYTVVADNGRVFEAKVAGFSNPDLGLEDWAMLRIAEAPAEWKPAELDCSRKAPPLGTPVRTEGFPGPEGSEFRVTFGWVDGLTAIFFDWLHPVMHLQMPVAPGNSGGPVIRMSDGAVLGIVTAYNTEFPQFSIATPIGVVCGILNRQS